MRAYYSQHIFGSSPHSATLQLRPHALFLTSLHFAVKGRNRDAEDHQPLRTFKLFRRLYCYSVEKDEFQPVPAMPPHLPHQICRALESLYLINTAGLEWRSHSLDLMLPMFTLLSLQCTAMTPILIICTHAGI